MPRVQERLTHQEKQNWPIQHELHVIEGVVFKGEKLVIPTGMRNEMLTYLHESHLGMEKCIVYWPVLGHEVYHYVLA